MYQFQSKTTSMKNKTEKFKELDGLLPDVRYHHHVAGAILKEPQECPLFRIDYLINVKMVCQAVKALQTDPSESIGARRVD